MIRWISGSTHHFRSTLALTLTGIAAVMALGVPSAIAQGDTLGVCSASVPLNLSPGLLLLTPTSGSNQSFGETGTLSCSGTIDGYAVAGPGTIGFKATYSGTCAQVSGGGRWFFTVPVYRDGSVVPLHREGTYNGPALASIIFFTGEFPGGQLVGTGAVMPTQGDCLTSPLTAATFQFTGLALGS